MKTVLKSEGYMSYLLFTLCCILLTTVIVEQRANAQTDNGRAAVQIKEGDQWDYYKGSQAPPPDWKKNSFKSVGWQKGMSGFGYGTAFNKTYLGDMKDNYLSVYARREFSINNIYTIIDMNLYMVCDGPFVAYLNGIEILRNDAIMKPAIDQATGHLRAEQLNISGFIHELMPGPNVISVECRNDDINSSDFTFIPSFEVIEYNGGEIQ